MTGQEYLYEIRRTVTESSRSLRLSNGGLGITSEAGEVAGLIKKHLHQGHELPSDEMLAELGDALWYLAFIAGEFGFTLEDVMAANVAKLRARYPNGWDTERSKNRDEES